MTRSRHRPRIDLKGPVRWERQPSMTSTRPLNVKARPKLWLIVQVSVASQVKLGGAGRLDAAVEKKSGVARLRREVGTEKDMHSNDEPTAIIGAAENSCHALMVGLSRTAEATSPLLTCCPLMDCHADRRMKFDFEPLQHRLDTLKYDERNNGILGKYQLLRHDSSALPPVRWSCRHNAINLPQEFMSAMPRKQACPNRRE